MGTQLRLVQRLPLAAGAQHIEDGISTGTIGHARSSSAEAMRIDVDRQERLEHRPEGIGDAKAGGSPIIGRASPLAFGSDEVFLFHAPEYIRLFG
jgi:hypothetical protein